MSLPYQVLPSFISGANALPYPVRVAALDLMASIERADVEGVPLEYRPSVGDLSDCFKLYFDPDPRNEKPRFRLVYRWIGGRLQGMILEGVAVGRRADLDVYLRAAEALGRRP